MTSASIAAPNRRRQCDRSNSNDASSIVASQQHHRQRCNKQQSKRPHHFSLWHLTVHSLAAVFILLNTVGLISLARADTPPITGDTGVPLTTGEWTLPEYPFFPIFGLLLCCLLPHFTCHTIHESNGQKKIWANRIWKWKKRKICRPNRSSTTNRQAAHVTTSLPSIFKLDVMNGTSVRTVCLCYVRMAVSCSMLKLMHAFRSNRSIGWMTLESIEQCQRHVMHLRPRANDNGKIL